MSGFCPHDWHQTTEADLQHMALGGGDFEYAVWDALTHPASTQRGDLERRQKVVTDKAHALAEQRGLIPYTDEIFLKLMQEVEANNG